MIHLGIVDFSPQEFAIALFDVYIFNLIFVVCLIRISHSEQKVSRLELTALP